MNYELFKEKVRKLVGAEVKVAFMSDVAAADKQHTAIVNGGTMFKNHPALRSIREYNNDSIVRTYNDELEVVVEFANSQDMFTKEQEQLEAVRAVLKTLKAAGKCDTDYLSDHMQGFAEGRNSERRHIIDMLEGILNAD